MISYLLKKGLILLASLLVVVTITFFLIHAIPGDPFIGERVLPEEVMSALYSHFGLDKPLWQQYLLYLNGLLHGELGPSIIYQGRSVNHLIAGAFPISLSLGLQALCIAIPAGILLGMYASLKKGLWQDHLVMSCTVLGVAVPNFVIASLLQYVLSIKFPLLPIARWDSFAHTILPTLALAALPTAYIARLTRSNLIEVLQEDYIKMALSKGIPYHVVAWKHGLKNALLPVVTYLGPVTSHILTGSFMIEKIFAIPGLGGWLIQSINGRDYPMIMGLTVFFTSFLMIMMFLVDIIYTLLNPRITLKKKYA